MTHHVLDARHTTEQIAAKDHQLTFATQGLKVTVGDTVTAETVDQQTIAGAIVAIGPAGFQVKFTTPRPATYDHLEDAVKAARAAFEIAHDAGLESDIASCADYFGYHAAIKAAMDVVLAAYRARLVKATLTIGELADSQQAAHNHYFRLLGKEQGVQLALSYLDEIGR